MNTTQIINRHIARTLSELEEAGCPVVFVEAVKRYLRWLRDDLQAMDATRIESYDRIRDAAVKAFAVSRTSASRDPIGRVRAEREFDVLFGVIQDEKRKAIGERGDERNERTGNE